MHPFIKDIKKNLEKMKRLARIRDAPVFRARKGFENDKFWVLIFVLLSSRTKDEITSKVVKNLINRYKNKENLAKAKLKDVEKLLYGVGFYKTKAKRIIEVANILINKEVPDSFDELIKLPGVGRKTANVVLNILFKKQTIGVDTHVHRISNRIGLLNTKNPSETEKELNKIIPTEYRGKLNEIFVAYGQTVCFPKNPDCKSCVINKHCFYFNKIFNIDRGK